MSELIAFDFDGVCCANVGAPRIGEPIQEALDAIRNLRTMGHRVVIYSHRPHGGQENVVRNWLRLHNVEVDEVRVDKMLYRLFIDDRAIEYPRCGLLMDAIMERLAR
jgi:hypothetical protein